MESERREKVKWSGDEEKKTQGKAGNKQTTEPQIMEMQNNESRDEGRGVGHKGWIVASSNEIKMILSIEEFIHYIMEELHHLDRGKKVEV